MVTQSHHHHSLPLSYRSRLLHHLTTSLKAGECCQVVGVSGSGKSNLVRFLLRPDVQQHYWHSEQIWPVLVDTHSLGLSERSIEYEVYETMVHGLVEEIGRRELTPAAASWAEHLHAELLQHHSAYIARRTLGQLCSALATQHHIRVVFMFDQFDRLWKDTAHNLFLSLRHLRDEVKYHVVYLIQTRDLLHHIRADQHDIEDFAELFATHSYGLGPYDEDDARTMVERLASRSGHALDERVTETAIWTSGGHASLLRTVYWSLHHGQTQGHTPAALLAVHTVRDECAKIWQDLTEDEQHVVQRLAAGDDLGHAHFHALERLRFKGLAHPRLPELSMPLLACYAAARNETTLVTMQIDRRHRSVTFDGRPLTRELAPLEFNLLAYLASRNGEVCPRDEIIGALYHEEALNTNDERLNTLVRRLRVALDDDARRPRFLVTRRGIGFQLLNARLHG